MRRLLATLVALLAALAAAVPVQADTVRVQRFSGFQDVTVSGTQTRYRLRLSYVVPGSWPARGRPRALSRRFGPIGSCRFTVRVGARAVADVSEAAASRVARLLPSPARLLSDEGTRRNAAWRVVRTTGPDVVTGLLVRPAPSVRTQPAGARAWLEVRFVARADPRRECHAGGPRTIGTQIGDALAVASAGGFQL
jgi:hypothetical protein